MRSEKSCEPQIGEDQTLSRLDSGLRSVISSFKALGADVINTQDKTAALETTAEPKNAFVPLVPMRAAREKSIPPPPPPAEPREMRQTSTTGRDAWPSPGSTPHTPREPSTHRHSGDRHRHSVPDKPTSSSGRDDNTFRSSRASYDRRTPGLERTSSRPQNGYDPMGSIMTRAHDRDYESSSRSYTSSRAPAPVVPAPPSEPDAFGDCPW